MIDQYASNSATRCRSISPIGVHEDIMSLGKLPMILCSAPATLEETPGLHYAAASAQDTTRIRPQLGRHKLEASSFAWCDPEARVSTMRMSCGRATLRRSLRQAHSVG